MNAFKLVLVILCFVAQGALDEVWARSHYDLEQKWTPEEALADMTVRFRYAPEDVKLREVNSFFNQLPYHGDVAGYALAKKQTLIKLGIEPYRLRAARVKHRETGDELVVLLVYPKGASSDAFVLDSFFPAIRLLSQRKDLFLVSVLADNEI